MRPKVNASGLLLIFLGAFLLTSYYLRFDPLEGRAEAYLEKSIKTTLASYVIVRGINASVSIIKESELSLSPAGVGLSLALGEVLDPLDDMVERVSTLLLLSFLSLGVQKLALDILSDGLLLISGVLALVCGAVLTLSVQRSGFLIKILLLLLVLRFLFPALVLANDLVYESFFRPKVEAVSSQLGSVKEEIQSLIRSADSTEGFREGLRNLKARLGLIFDNLLQLALYFTLQTLILPLLNLWITLRLALGTFRLKV